MKPVFSFLNRIGLCCLLSLWILSASGQSETHDFVTYDTIVKLPGAGQPTYALRISRPSQLFNASHPDAAPRPLLMTMPGAGEVSTDTNALKRFTQYFGPHYWLSHGWDGGVQLGNGTHYPILITLACSASNVRPWILNSLVDFILNTYHIKRNSVHVGGLSMGGWTWGRYITYSAGGGDDSYMAKIKSFVSLEGIASDNFNSLSWNIDGFGRWAQKYDGRLLGLEGTMDTRNIWAVRNNMDASRPGNAYFSYQNLGGGGHCCWNSMYDPSVHDWQSVAPITNRNIQVNNTPGHQNSMGTYKNGSSVFQWMLRQGDTTLVGTGNVPPTVNAGSSQVITLPISLTTLNGTAQANGPGNSIRSLTWTKTSGPACIILSVGSLITTVIGLLPGNYEFTLTAKDNLNQTASSAVQVSVLTAPPPPTPTVSAGTDQTITLPVSLAHLSGSAIPNGGSTLAKTVWSQIAGPNTAIFTDSLALTTDVSGLATGIYTFNFTATNSGGGTATSSVKVTVDPALPPPPPIVDAGTALTSTLPKDSVQLAGTAAANGGLSISKTAWSQLTGPNTAVFSDSLSLTSKIRGLQAGTYTFQLFALNSAGGSATSTVSVTVNSAPPALPPSVNVGADQTISLPQDFIQLTASATPNGGGSIVKTTWVQLNGPNTGIIADSLALSTSVSGLLEGTYSFRFSATSNEGVTASAIASVTVNAAAAPVNPTVDAGTDQTITLPASTAGLTGSATANGGLTVSSTIWTQMSGPTAAVIADSTNLTTAISSLEEGTYSFRLTVTNSGGGTASDIVTIAVNGAAAPVNPTVDAGTDQTITLPASTAGLTGSATANGGLTISRLVWTQLSGPTAAVIADSTNLSTTISSLEEGTYSFQLTVTNSGGGTASDIVTITVDGAAAPVNPTVDAGTDQTITLPVSTAGLTGSATANGGLTISSTVWTQLGGPTVAVIADSTNLSTTISSLVQGTYSFQLTVTNSGGGTASDIVTITVDEAVAPVNPTVDAGTDQTITLPASTAGLTGSATANGGLTISSLVWTQLSGPTAAVIADSTNLSTTISSLDQGMYSFRLTVTNSGGGAASDEVIIMVNSAPPPPQSMVSNIKVGEGEYQVYFTDSLKHLWGLGNLSNLGVKGAGILGVPQRVQVTPFDLKFNVVAGGLHGGAAVDTAGYVWVMGDNDQAQHGQGDYTDIWMPRKITVDSANNAFNNIQDVVGFAYKNTTGGIYNGFYAIKRDGTLWTWGRTWAGMRGNGTDLSKDNARPVQIHIPGNRSVKQIVAGFYAIALCTDGTVWTWGKATIASLGYAATNIEKLSPHQLTQLSNVTQIAGGIAFNYALRSDGALFGWGFNGTNLGDTYFPTGAGLSYPVPVLLPNITNNLPGPIAKIVTNQQVTHAILEDGSLWGWGDNAQGSVGNGQKAVYTTPYAWSYETGLLWVRKPVNIAPTKKFNNVFGSSVYTFYTYALDTDGKLYCWGRGKASVLAKQIRSGSASLESVYPNSFDRAWPTPVDPFHQTVSYVSTSPYCITSPSGSPCSNYVIPSNTKPVANAGADQSITTFTTSLNGTASADNVYISYNEWTQLSGPNKAIMDLPGSAAPRISGLTNGIYVFKLKVTDNGWLTDSSTVRIAVNAALPANQPPKVNAGTDQSIVLPVNTVTLNGSATDNDGVVATKLWTLLSGPSSSIIVTPSQLQTTVSGLVAGVYQFELKATDDKGLFAKDTVIITVHAAPPAANQPPSVNGGINVSIISPNSSVSLTGTATDADGTIASKQWSFISGPAQHTIASPAQFQTIINNLVIGVYKFEFKATDNNGATSRDTITVTVNASAPVVNQPPSVNAGSNQSITLPVNSVVLTGTTQDPDGTIASQVWTKISGPAQGAIQTPAQLHTSVNSMAQGIYKFELKVTDNDGAIGRDTMMVTVNAAPPPPNKPPVAVVGNNIIITLPNSTVSLSGTGSYDPDGVIAGQLWTKVSGPAVYVITSPTKLQTTVTGLAEGTYKFELKVTDNKQAVGTAYITVTVKPGTSLPPVSQENEDPIADAGEKITIALPINTANVDGSKSVDPDGTIVSYEWTKVSGPEVYKIISPNSKQTEIINLVAGNYRFQLKVTDNKGAVGTSIVEILVMPGSSSANLYPNPATSVINLSIHAATQKNHTAIIIYDAAGRPVIREEFNRDVAVVTKQIDVSRLIPGTYFVYVTVDINNVQILPFIKL